jgi:hypothetical protein
MSPNPGDLAVDPVAFATAGKTFGTAREAAARTITTLANALDDNWGCAGTDTTGQTFAGQYDPAAFNAIGSGADIVNALGKLNDLLQYTSVNHANGNTQAAIDAKPNNTVSPPPLTPHFETPKFKGSYGGDSNAPLGWSLITRWLQGRVWPNGHQDKLHNLNSAWHAAASGLEQLVTPLPEARETVKDQGTAEIPKILGQIDLVTNLIAVAASQYRDLGDACFNYADALSKAHDAIGTACAEVLIAAGIGAIAGSFIGPEGTAGGGGLATAAAGARAGAACVSAIDALSVIANAVRGALAGVAVAAGPVTKALQPLLDATARQFNAETGDGAGSSAAQSDTFADSWKGSTNRGTDYEDYANSKLGAESGFKNGGRDFDGKIPGDGGPDTWLESKSGNFWNDCLSNTARMQKFKSQIGSQLRLAQESGAKYMIVSERPIPPEITQWLDSKGIPYKVVP